MVLSKAVQLLLDARAEMLALKQKQPELEAFAERLQQQVLGLQKQAEERGARDLQQATASVQLLQQRLDTVMEENSSSLLMAERSTTHAVTLEQLQQQIDDLAHELHQQQQQQEQQQQQQQQQALPDAQGAPPAAPDPRLDVLCSSAQDGAVRGVGGGWVGRVAWL